MTLTEP